MAKEARGPMMCTAFRVSAEKELQVDIAAHSRLNTKAANIIAAQEETANDFGAP